jgi:hypothetical protein
MSVFFAFREIREIRGRFLFSKQKRGFTGREGANLSS